MHQKINIEATLDNQHTFMMSPSRYHHFARLKIRVSAAATQQKKNVAAWAVPPRSGKAVRHATARALPFDIKFSFSFYLFPNILEARRPNKKAKPGKGCRWKSCALSYQIRVSVRDFFYFARIGFKESRKKEKSLSRASVSVEEK